MTTITCPVNDTSGICSTMDGAGAGLGVFIQYMGQALPYLLIVLGLVAIIIAVGFAVAGVIKGAVTGVHRR